ncbi:hypothetical protein LSAT2_006980, partial [Lamellibrachia satsuma]
QLARSCSWHGPAAGAVLQLARSCSWHGPAASAVLQLTRSCSWHGPAASQMSRKRLPTKLSWPEIHRISGDVPYDRI